MFGRAHENARAIGARSFELRILNDLVQTAIAAGDNSEAAQLLAPVYECFDGAAATADLKKSARLLAAANRAPILLQMEPFHFSPPSKTC